MVEVWDGAREIFLPMEVDYFRDVLYLIIIIIACALPVLAYYTWKWVTYLPCNCFDDASGNKCATCKVKQDNHNNPPKMCPKDGSSDGTPCTDCTSSRFACNTGEFFRDAGNNGPAKAVCDSIIGRGALCNLVGWLGGTGGVLLFLGLVFSLVKIFKKLTNREQGATTAGEGRIWPWHNFERFASTDRLVRARTEAFEESVKKVQKRISKEKRALTGDGPDVDALKAEYDKLFKYVGDTLKEHTALAESIATLRKIEQVQFDVKTAELDLARRGKAFSEKLNDLLKQVGDISPTTTNAAKNEKVKEMAEEFKKQTQKEREATRETQKAASEAIDALGKVKV